MTHTLNAAFVCIKLAVCAGSRNFSILGFAGLLAVATTVGGILLTDAVDVGEPKVKEGLSGATAQLQQLTSAPVDDNSKLLLQVVLALFGVTAVGVGESAATPTIFAQSDIVHEHSIYHSSAMYA